MIAKSKEENCCHNKEMEADLYCAVQEIWHHYTMEEML